MRRMPIREFCPGRSCFSTRTYRTLCCSRRLPMSLPPDRLDRLYQLLPVIYRQRDLAQGEQLHALLRVVAEQVAIVEDDISRLYENWFIETYDDWAVPYMAYLIDNSSVHA